MSRILSIVTLFIMMHISMSTPLCASQLPVLEKSSTFEEIITQDKFFIDMSNRPDLKSRHKAKTLLIGCVDFRFRDESVKLMKLLKLFDNYDEIDLAGASLAFVENTYPDWNKTIEESIKVIEGLHHIENVIFLDHRDCGAFKLLGLTNAHTTKEQETEAHKIVLTAASKKMKEKFPKLKVYKLLMGIDGVVDNIKEN